MRKLIIATVLCLAAACAAASAAEIKDGETLSFDFGANAEKDYISVSAKDKYDAKKGYGFASPADVENVAAPGEGALSDAVKFNKTGRDSSAAFNVDLPEGMYKIKVYAGDIERISVAAEGQFAIMNITGKNGMSEVEIPVTDGQLNILATEGKDGTPQSLSAIEITKIPADEPRKTRVFIGGDSITTTYYPLEVSELTTNTQGGWGQMLQAYLPDNFYVHNFATGGQFAKGFLESGQFEAIETLMQEGDYFIVGFGINDQNYSNEDEFIAAMTEMVERTKAKGGIPIIVTTQGRLGDFNSDGIFYKPGRWYKASAKKIAEEQGIHYVDLHDLSSAYFTAIGEEDTTKLFWIDWQGKQDTLHSCREGAGHMARLIVEELLHQGFSEFESDKVMYYGGSTDITLKVGAKNRVLLFQNLKPSAQSVSFLVISYDEDGIIKSSRVETLELPPFDVLNPAAKTEFAITDSDMAYVYIDGMIRNITGGFPYSAYEIPAFKAKMYENYVVPTPEPTPETKEN